ncbi:hypothetical protein DFQ28_007155 [Apophysomyces sp. BC1034]|nr:hypothetical protein DFQ30_006957 [Apophysomyces sp. BC1015]KAG0176618.1 hypothetical protein DFQ29_005884 [Apophysomyces sp. BC1021]KAG0186910.1 hypothetical protein DFQ28_007155 [Apophysomyces sp. BC1034]
MPKCTRKGCEKEFNEAENAVNFTQEPRYFMKGWSCCNKRVVDFDEFLQLPGCNHGRHSTEKPVTPQPSEKVATSAASQVTKDGVEVYGQVKQAAPKPVAVAPVAKAETEQKKEPEVEEEDDESVPVPVGTICKRRGCGIDYKDESTSRSNGTEAACRYHPGAPVFHEGSKGWSCCPRKVLEFEEFLKIQGCKVGKHLFVGSSKGKAAQEELVDCRTDWYQTQTGVILSIFAKNKENTEVRFENQSTIDPENSKSTVLSTKIELNMKKTSGVSWAALEPTADVKTWTTFGVTGTGGTVGSKEVEEKHLKLHHE